MRRELRRYEMSFGLIRHLLENTFNKIIMSVFRKMKRLKESFKQVSQSIAIYICIFNKEQKKFYQIFYIFLIFK